nr:Hpt domain-containing protein [Desulfobacterales bacterium]
MTDFSLLQDFIVETVEHLEEMEGNLLRLEADPDNRETLDEIFRSVHTIKGASEYLGLDGLAELSHKLENLLDGLRKNEHTVNRDVINLLMAARDRMGLLVEDIESTQTEQTVFADLIEQLQNLQETAPSETDDAATNLPAASPESTPAASSDPEYEEEYDEELFAIFLDQIEEGLTGLRAQAHTLQTADMDDRRGLLDNCLTRIDPLRSSANYMGYDRLTDLYDSWSESIRNARERLSAGDDAFMPDFI